ncbi:lipase member I [Lepeophtheirus salmonis]|uniref:lipase member I n=1 Tax=Lepeophtheirus salmonis TaxID=72036 RepID=UPI003AF35237
MSKSVGVGAVSELGSIRNGKGLGIAGNRIIPYRVRDSFWHKKSCQSDLGSMSPVSGVVLEKCPQNVELIGLEMKLYTRNNLETPQIFKYDEAQKLNESNFNAAKLTRTLVHGYKTSCDHEWAVGMRQALLNESDINVFCANWENGASPLLYDQAVANTHIVGLMIAKFFNDVRLDPAGPAFSGKETKFRLDKDDADFVDVIHTNGFGLGIYHSSGHVDFYANGGEKQPKCKSVELLIYFLGGAPCSHDRAPMLYTETIRNKGCKMNGFPCKKGWEAFLMGECHETSETFPFGLNTPRNARGLLYFTTRDEAQYCGNQLKTSIRVVFERQQNWFGKLHNHNLELFFFSPSGESEQFTIASGFSESGSYSKVFTLDAKLP